MPTVYYSVQWFFTHGELVRRFLHILGEITLFPYSAYPTLDLVGWFVILSGPEPDRGVFLRAEKLH